MGAEYAQTTVNAMVLNAFHVWDFSFFVSEIVLGVMSVDFWGPRIILW